MAAKRGVRVTVLCEDREHDRFVRHALRECGFAPHERRFLPRPAVIGAAEQWVRERYTREVLAHRRRASSQNVALLVVIDADTRSVDDRHRELQRKLVEAGHPVRSENEPIVIWIPKRHIETWVAYFADGDANESDDYKRAMRDADYRPPAERFVHFFRVPEDRPEDLLPSISTALGELDRLPDRSG